MIQSGILPPVLYASDNGLLTFNDQLKILAELFSNP